ncbi:MAG: CPBP family intramembrane metalloprotease [Planctomycetes bacterium]|nr:CPBP family intramembrane metalloprotease [Planctomycetota bacterium]
MTLIQHRPPLFECLRVRNLFVWIIAGFILAATVLGDGMEETAVQILFVCFTTLWPLLWLCWKFKRQGVALYSFIGPMPENRFWIRWILISLGLSAFSSGALYFVWYPLSFVWPRFIEELLLNDHIFYSEDGTPLSPPLLVLEMITGIILGPFAEELIFRGVILQRWAVKWGMRRALVWSSILFGILHMDLIGGVFFGIVLGILFIKTRTLWVPMFCHALNNATAYLFAGMEYGIKGPVNYTIEEYRSEAWQGYVLLLVTIPWIAYFCRKNWPLRECSIPYSPDPVESTREKTS